MNVKHVSGVQANGIFASIWALRLPWAHPCWSEYALWLYDLKVTADREVTFLLPGATHEFILYAIDPSTPWDFEKNPEEQPEIVILQPANLGYQFIAESDKAAMERLNGCVMEMLAKKLSPDTDFRRMWDERFRDGKSMMISDDELYGLIDPETKH